MAYTLKELRALKIEDIVNQYDSLIIHAVGTPEFYLNEIYRREQEKQTKAIVSYTKWITGMTFIMMLTTIINLIVFFCKNGN